MISNYYEAGTRAAERVMGLRGVFPTLNAVCVYMGGNPDSADDLDAALWLYGETRRIGDAFRKGLLPWASAVEELSDEATGSRFNAEETLSGYIDTLGL